jgi:predicted amidohydrolase YtcJ
MQAELLLKNAAIYTLDPAQPRASSLAVAGGRIVAVSGHDRLDDLRGPTTRVLDVRGRAVVPGFVDAHVHFGSYALARQQVDLDTADTMASALAMLREAAERLPADAWLRGRGWDRNRWGRLPVAADLDTVVGNRPAALASRDGHSIWLGSAALRTLGIDRNTSAPPGGVIEFDAHGEPTGVLSENAQHLVEPHLPRPSAAEMRTAIREALPVAAAAGLTGIHNFEDGDSRQAFQVLEADGELTLRVYHGVSRDELGQAREQASSSGRTLRTLAFATGAGSDWLRVGPLKLFSDGALGSRTAQLLEPYAGSQDGYRGVATIEPAEMAEAMRLAADAELDLAIHAIGDAAVRTVLDTFEQTRQVYPALSRRMLRIEHSQLVHPQDVPRFAALGAIASMQPVHATSDWRAADAHWGARSRYGYAWRALLMAGADLAFGTDAPVEGIEPLASLYAATTRMDRHGEPGGGWYPEQALSLEEAIRAYTTGSAIAERASARRGSLRPGNDADLVVLTPDPFPLDPSALRDTRVALTMVGGRIIFEGD